MKRFLYFALLIMASSSSFSQNKPQQSSIDFVTVLNNNHVEALYYYQNNWKALRAAAIKNDYIASYQFIEIEPSEDTPFNFILVTTYSNQEQYEKRETHFQSLIKSSGGLKLLNGIEPKDFRKVIHSQDPVKNW